MGLVALSVIGLIASVLMSAGGYVYNEAVQGKSNEVRKKAENLAKQIYTKLMANSQTREKLQEAYSRKDNALLSSLISQAGYSAQATALRKEINNSKAKYQDEKRSLDKQSTELTNQYNKLNNAANYSGSTIAGNKYAEETVNDVENLVNGGYHEEEKLPQ